MLKDRYTDEEFWEQNPILDTVDSSGNSYYDIDQIPYEQDEETGDWIKVDQ